MKFYVCEGTPEGNYNASTKARQDVEKILSKNNYKKLYINTVNGVQKNKLLKFKQLFVYTTNKFFWKNKLNELNPGDIVLIQYPLINTTYGLDKTINNFRKKGLIFVALIHDMDSLRYKPEIQGRLLYSRIKKEDKKILNSVNYIIAHNNSMKNELISLGNDVNKIITLELFDYLLDFEPKHIERIKDDPIIIAGNLSEEKTRYISEIKKLKGLKFNLYGSGFNFKNKSNNLSYKGKYLPEELINHLEGSFGLVWDGNSIFECIGGFGEYLKYNNPHKVSLYMASGLPVIVWKKSALNEFILKNNLGVSVDNLSELDRVLENISERDYDKMKNNVKKLSEKVKNGYFLETAIKKLERKIKVK